MTGAGRPIGGVHYYHTRMRVLFIVLISFVALFGTYILLGIEAPTPRRRRPNNNKTHNKREREEETEREREREREQQNNINDFIFDKKWYINVGT